MNENDFTLHHLKTESLSQNRTSAFQKHQTGLFGSIFHELFKCKSENIFMGHPVEKTDDSKFQIFEIQVFVFKYRKIIDKSDVGKSRILKT